MWGLSHTVLPDGHRLFQATPEYAIVIGRSHGTIARPLTAIADDSGLYPEQTDSGVLWLDYSKSLMIGGKPEHCTIPVLDPDSRPQRVETDASTILCLSNNFLWDINVHGILMRATKLHARRDDWLRFMQDMMAHAKQTHMITDEVEVFQTPLDEL